MLVRQLFDLETFTYTYIVADLHTREAVIIDPVLEKQERDVKLLQELDLKLVHVLETHVHADHITSASRLRTLTGARTAASAQGAPCVDIALKHGDTIRVGQHILKVLDIPGHTNDSICFYTPGHVFTGDALMVRTCGRTDFQNGDSADMYRSVHEHLFVLPDETIVWPGHDYQGFTSSTIGEEKRYNVRLAGKTLQEFTHIMNHLNLAPPKKLNEAVPANLKCGEA